MKKSIKGVIITKVRKNDSELKPETVREMLEIPIIGMVPEDISVQEALNQKDAVVHTHPKSKASRAYKEIAASIMGIEYDSNSDRESMMEKLSKWLKLKK